MGELNGFGCGRLRTTSLAEERHNACLSFSKHPDKLKVKAGVAGFEENNIVVWSKVLRAQIEKVGLPVHPYQQP